MRRLGQAAQVSRQEARVGRKAGRQESRAGRQVGRQEAKAQVDRRL